MKLHVLKTILLDLLHNFVGRSIHKHACTLGLDRQIVGFCTDIALGSRPKYEANDINFEGFHIANILGIAHTANFDIHRIKN